MEGVLQPFLCTWAWSQEKAIQVDFFLNELLCVLSLVAAHVNSGSEQWIRGHRAHKDSPSQMPSQQMIDEVWETDWKACKLPFSFSPFLPPSAASMFSCLSYWKISYSWPAGFSETFGRKMSTHKEQLWDKLNHQERRIERTAAGSFFSFFSFLTVILLPACLCNGFLHLRHHILNFGWWFFDAHVGHWQKAIYCSKVLNNSVSFLFFGHWGKLPPIHGLSCEFIGGWLHTTPCLYVDKNFWAPQFLVWKSQYI